MFAQEIVFEKDQTFAKITFNRPEVHNALNTAMVDGLVKALRLTWLPG